jgi:hypothetical protein
MLGLVILRGAGNNRATMLVSSSNAVTMHRLRVYIMRTCHRTLLLLRRPLLVAGVAASS